MNKWKWVGIAGLLGMVATGVLVSQRRRRQWRDYDADEIRARLHERFEQARAA